MEIEEPVGLGRGFGEGGVEEEVLLGCFDQQVVFGGEGGIALCEFSDIGDI